MPRLPDQPARRKTGRAGGARAARLTRTILLGAVALFFVLVWLVRELEMDAAELAGYAGTSLLWVGFLALLGLAGAALVMLVKRLLRRR